MPPASYALLATRQKASAFNQPLSFNTSSVTTMHAMFLVRSARAPPHRSPFGPSPAGCMHCGRPTPLRLPACMPPASYCPRDRMPLVIHVLRELTPCQPCGPLVGSPCVPRPPQPPKTSWPVAAYLASHCMHALRLRRTQPTPSSHVLIRKGPVPRLASYACMPSLQLGRGRRRSTSR